MKDIEEFQSPEAESYFYSGLAKFTSLTFKDAIVDFNKAIELDRYPSYDCIIEDSMKSKLPEIDKKVIADEDFISEFDKFLDLDEGELQRIKKNICFPISPKDTPKESSFINGIKNLKNDLISQALEDFNVCIQNDSYNVNLAACYFRGEAIYRLNIITNNIHVSDYNIHIDRDHSRSFIECKNKFNNNSFNKIALEDFTKVIKSQYIYFKLNIVKAYLFRGLSNFYLCNYNESLRDFDLASDLCPVNVELNKYRVAFGHDMSQLNLLIDDLNLIPKENPNNLKILSNRVDINNSKDKNQSSSINDNRSAIELLIQNISLNISSGQSNRDAGNFESSIQNFRNAFFYKKLLEIIYSSRASIRGEQGEFDLAIQDLTAALHLNPNNHWYYDQIGNLKYKLGDYHGAIKEYTYVADITQHDSSIYTKLGDAKIKIGDFKGAIKEYLKRIKREPSELSNYFDLSYAKFLSGDINGAMDDYNRSGIEFAKISKINNTEENPMVDFSELIENLNDGMYLDHDNILKLISANKLSGIFNFIQSVKEFNQQREIDRENMSSFFNRGKKAFDENNYYSAISCLTKSLKISSISIDTYLLRGKARSRLGQYYLSMEDFSKVIELEPNNPKGYYVRALHKQINVSMTDYDGSIIDANEAIRLGFDLCSALQLKASAEVALENYIIAIEDYNKIIELNNKLANSYFWRAYARTEVKDYEGAISDFSACIDISADSNAYYLRGELKLKLGDMKGACEDWFKAGSMGDETANYMLETYFPDM